MTRSDSLLFLLNISGVSDYANSTEEQHARMLLAEFKYAVGGSNNLGMEVSELSDSQLIFYRSGDIPEIVDVVGQVDAIYKLFKNLQNQYVKRRICNCAICRSVERITIQFVVHAGHIAFISVRNKMRLHGPAVILAQKLIENQIEDEEYILFTDKLLSSSEQPKFADPYWKIKRSIMQYPDLGEIDFNYLSLDEREISLQEETVPEGIKVSNPISSQMEFDANIYTVLDVLMDISNRESWNGEQREIKFDESNLLRAGMEYQCTIQSKKYTYQIVSGTNGDQIVFGESIKQPAVVKAMTNYFILDPVGSERTSVKFQIHYQSKGGLGAIVAVFYKMGLVKMAKNILQSLKENCEKLASIPSSEQKLTQ